MSAGAWALLAVFLGLLLVLAWPLAAMIDHVMSGRAAALSRVESRLWRVLGIDPAREQGWVAYGLGLLVFNGLGLVALYAVQRLQGVLPFNPAGLGAVNADTAFNTAVSFVSNTNWQSYAGESTMSHLTQMLGLTVQNFLSAATGIVVVIALIRGFTRDRQGTLGQVWVDLTRVTLWVLLPLSCVWAVAFAALGVVQTLDASVAANTLEGATQHLALGPVASQLAIKMLGTNGGGFFNANSAHPFENPSAATNLLQMLAIFLIPAALCMVLGRMVGDRRQGLAILLAMALLFVAFVVPATYAEQQGHPALSSLGVDQAASPTQSGGSMEGKEVRFGIDASALFAVITTAASCGAVNAMHDSLTPIGGGVTMALMQLGEVVFGGVGSGLYGMLVFAIVIVFVAGLMIGRTPEYLGKKIETRDMKMVAIALLVTPSIVLLGTALAVSVEAGRAGILNPGIHGFSEILYALSSAGNNNGSAFAGLSANTPFYNVLLAVAMWLGRFGVIVPVLAVAGSLAAKTRLAPHAGTLPTHGPLFVILLVGAVPLFGLLNYLPALALGPIAEHLLLWSR